MSLINDALKRARQTQQEAAPAAPPNLQFRPVEPAQRVVRHGVGLMLPIAFAVIALLGLLFLWQVQKNAPNKSADTSNETTVVAHAREIPENPPLATAPVVSLTEQTKSSVRSPLPLQTRVASSVVPVANADDISAPSAKVQENSSSAATPGADTGPAKPAPLKLQAIVFNPSRPSAIINGRTLFIGDKMGTFRVVAIGEDTATLAGSGLTNVLTLVP
jgi:hypothetical protein